MPVGPEGSTPNYMEEALLKHVTGVAAYSPHSTLWLALGTSPPQESDRYSWSNELSGGGYQRQQIEFTPAKTSISSTDCVTTIRNKCPLFFHATADWAEFKYFAIWSAQTGGELLYWAEYTATAPGAPPIVVKKAECYVIQNCWLEIMLTKNHYTSNPIQYVTWSQYLQEKMLNLVFRNQSFSPPPNWLALSFNEPTCDQDGSDLSEPSPSAGYGRVLLGSWQTPSQETDLARITTDGTYTFPTPTGDWSVPGWFAVCDEEDVGTGNLLYWQDAFEPAGPIESGDNVTADNISVLIN
jgi:hypothetical protein